MSIKEKKKLLADFIEKHVQCGFSIVEYMGKPLSYFDFDKVEARIKWLNKEYQLEQDILTKNAKYSKSKKLIETSASARLLNCLKYNNDKYNVFKNLELNNVEDITLFQLSQFSYKDYMKFDNIGKMTIEELRSLLIKNGINFKV